VEQVGSPLELYEKPNSRFVAGFIGSPKMNFLEGPFAQTYKAHAIGIRPEHLEATDGEGQWSGKILHIEKLGSDSFLYIDTGTAAAVCCRHSGNTPLVPDQVVSIKPTGPVYRFDNNGRAM
jgi:multiple sugar transport system ATP-binding protein